MSKLRIGVIVNAENTPSDGGAHTYFNTLLKAINDYSFDSSIEILNIVFYKTFKPVLKKPTIYIKAGYGMQLKSGVKEKLLKFKFTSLTRQNPLINLGVKSLINKRNRKIEDTLREAKIDVIYYLKPEFDIINYPFIATHWDVAHRSLPPFPEVAMYGNYEMRENYYLYTLNRALSILCESKSGADELKKYYSFLEEKIKVLPLFAGDVIDVKTTESYEAEVLAKYNLMKKQFFVYPAQFWSLKNHYNLIVAFSELVKNGNRGLKLVLSGSDKGNQSYIEEVVRALSLKEQVIFPGFISNTELSVFYKNAIALTMPTFLGPTNLPLLEAAHFGCPVICSNLEGHKELMGEAALYVDPTNPTAIKEAMEKLLDKKTSGTLTDAGQKHVSKSPFNLQNSLSVLNQVFLDIMPIRKTWGI